jgi:hypothetical protein
MNGLIQVVYLMSFATISNKQRTTTLFAKYLHLLLNYFRDLLLTLLLIFNWASGGQTFIPGEMWGDLHTFRPKNFEYWAKSGGLNPHFDGNTISTASDWLENLDDG